MKIEIYGTGCAKCKTLYENAQKAVTELGMSAELIKVEDINEITDAGIMFTPGLSVDGEIKSVGKLLSIEEIKKIIT